MPLRRVRVFSLVPARRYAGLAVVDGFGMPEHGFQTCKLDRFRSLVEKKAAFALRLTRALRKFRPTLAVLGIPKYDDDTCRALRKVAETIFKSAGLPFVIRSVAESRHLLLGKYMGDSEDEFAKSIVSGFLPELARFLKPSAIIRQYRRHAWEAVGLAITELLGRAPLQAAALARPGAFAMGTIAETLQQAAQSQPL
jgi:hypothetical protein